MHFWAATPPPLLYAHRGASAELPENTLPAFRRALELGADVLELDVHAARDGVFIVSHDPTGERSCGVSRRIDACDWPEVSTWDTGWGFVDAAGERPHLGAGIHPARLDEVVRELAPAPLNVDVKRAHKEQLRSLIALVRDAGAEERVLLTSFSLRELRAIRRLGYEGPLGLSRAAVARLFFLPELAGRLFPFSGERAQIPTASGPFDLTKVSFIEKCHRLRLAVDYWVVNDALLAETLLERGADGIVTDNPRAIAAALSRSPRAAAWRERHGGRST